MLFLLQSLTLGISSWNFQLETSYARIFRFIHMNILKVKLRLHHILFWYIRNCWASWWFGVLVTSSWCTPDLDAFRLMKFKWKFSVARLQVDTSGFHPREFFFALPCLVITPNFEFSSLNLVSEPSVNFVIFTFVNFWVSVNDQSVKSPISKCLAMSSIEYLQEVHWTLIDLPNQSLNSLTNPSLFPSQFTDGYETEYACEGDSVHIKCKRPGTVINVVRAAYGRYSIATCNPQGVLNWSVDCTSHKTLYVIQNR